jgi:hypothetical protein
MEIKHKLAHQLICFMWAATNFDKLAPVRWTIIWHRHNLHHGGVRLFPLAALGCHRSKGLQWATCGGLWQAIFWCKPGGLQHYNGIHYYNGIAF